MIVYLGKKEEKKRETRMIWGNYDFIPHFYDEHIGPNRNDWLLDQSQLETQREIYREFERNQRQNRNSRNSNYITTSSSAPYAGTIWYVDTSE